MRAASDVVVTPAAPDSVEQKRYTCESLGYAYDEANDRCVPRKGAPAPVPTSKSAKPTTTPGRTLPASNTTEPETPTLAKKSDIGAGRIALAIGAMGLCALVGVAIAAPLSSKA